MESYFPDLSKIGRKKEDNVKSVFGDGENKACVSLEARRKAPCAKFRGPPAFRRTCPAMEPDEPMEPPPCM